MKSWTQNKNKENTGWSRRGRQDRAMPPLTSNHPAPGLSQQQSTAFNIHTHMHIEDTDVTTWGSTTNCFNQYTYYIYCYSETRLSPQSIYTPVVHIILSFCIDIEITLCPIASTATGYSQHLRLQLPLAELILVSHFTRSLYTGWSKKMYPLYYRYHF